MNKTFKMRFRNHLSQSKAEPKKNCHKHKIELIDSPINEAVYHLYGLTEKEIRIVEGK